MTVRIPADARYYVIEDATEELQGDYATLEDAREMVEWDGLQGVTIYAAFWDYDTNSVHLEPVQGGE